MIKRIEVQHEFPITDDNILSLLLYLQIQFLLFILPTFRPSKRFIVNSIVSQSQQADDSLLVTETIDEGSCKVF